MRVPAIILLAAILLSACSTTSTSGSQAYQVTNRAGVGLIPNDLTVADGITLEIKSETDARFYEPSLQLDQRVKAGDSIQIKAYGPPGSYKILCIEGCSDRSVFNLTIISIKRPLPGTT